MSYYLVGRALREDPSPRPSTKADGGLWYTDANDAMWQTSSSSNDGSNRSVSSEISGLSAKTTSRAAAGSVDNKRQ